ncbi:unnamed protein product [Vitrella brassicaformis CCMP3155]|uniref:Cilia- and flagella-associated protein 418 n=1 Tax=Vitrella brassicaformis (strain CCMP3155) TaxID=1169540 RepID=A0A0G4G617_VITBC|nr:unnamed protein product [Vitrella brassicaformis CCMP3155]|eukprot:CEM23660.1 unnamed protein product [Vitrella brassicaformis CCMP3155]
MTESVDELLDMLDECLQERPHLPTKNRGPNCATSSGRKKEAVEAAADSSQASVAARQPCAPSAVDQLLSELALASDDALQEGRPLHSLDEFRTSPIRCDPPMLGGSSCRRGLSSRAAASQGAANGQADTCCDNMRCLACDKQVLQFSGVAWSGRVDCMFFRNHHPSRERLSKGWRASLVDVSYCCQCSWLTVSSLLPLSSRPELRWRCYGH